MGLYHVENLTPEAKAQGEALIREGAPVYVIDDAELERVKAGYPCVWKDLGASPKLCFVAVSYTHLAFIATITRSPSTARWKTVCLLVISRSLKSP